MSSVSLGKDAASGSTVLLDEAHRQSGLYILGKPRMGKTTLIEHLVAQDMQAGAGVCVLDPSGDLIHRVLGLVPPEREDHVVLLDAADYSHPFGLNPFDCDDPSDPLLVNRIQGQFVDIFRKLWGQAGSQGTSWGPRLEDLLRSIALTFIENPPYTMAEISLLLINETFRHSLVSNVSNDEVRRFWAEFDALRGQALAQEISSTMNKVRAFLTQPIVKNIVGQSKTTAKFRTFMENRNIVLVPLSVGRLGSDTVELLGSLMVLDILNAALEREDLRGTAESVPRFNLYVDEYQRFATESFAKLLEEARKYEVSVTFAHQNRSQLDERNRAASLMAGAILSFGVEGHDGEEMAKQFDRTPTAAKSTRQQPIRAICRTPVEYLCQHPHKLDPVSYVARERLVPLLELTNEPKRLRDERHPKAFMDRWYERIEHKKDAIIRLNRFLVQMMQGTIKTLSGEQAAAVAEIAWDLQNTVDPEIYELFDPPKALSKEAKTGLVDLFWAVFNTKARHGDKTDVENAQAALKVILDLEDNLGPPEAHFTTLLYSYGLLSLGLAKEPIYLDTGQWETVENDRPYSDVKAEVENMLVGLGPFRAHAKILQGNDATEGLFYEEYDLDTPWPNSIDPLAHAERVSRIRERSRQSYCKPRHDVEEDIRRRQEPSNNSPMTPTRGPVPIQLDHIGGESKAHSSMFCLECGRQLAVDARFCQYCGKPTDPTVRSDFSPR